MTPTPRHRTRTLALTAGAAVLAAALTACGSAGTGGANGMSGMDHGASTATPAASPSGGHQGHQPPGADSATAAGTTATPGSANAPGLAAEQNGYRLDPATGTLPAGTPTEYRFTVTGPDGSPVTAYQTDQTMRMHAYAIRSDLTGFQHLHPEMAADGTWTAPLTALAPGDWRVYASFIPDSGAGKGTGLVLSRPVTVPGDGSATAAEPPATTGTTTGTATVDGYTVAVEGTPVAGRAGELKVTVSRDGKPVTDLQPYLDTFAHLTAFHTGDQAFAHLHPEAGAEPGGTGGPTLAFHAELPAAGDWRLFLQFRTGGTLHTAAVTLKVVV
ncbi:hypothetical protein [Kitasatospora sp. NPDC088351]|uniref:hypothetical protein n=1 Tax=unclassified Kitasatospora TaxID=2633591 RepID=UPI00342BD841